MSRHLPKTLPFVLLLALLFFACTEEELGRGREAEADYVDLLYALKQANQASARLAADQLTSDLATLRVRWYRPLKDEDADDRYFHLSKAQAAFVDTRQSIREGQLEVAAVQLDRAVYELSAADPVAFNELYVGGIYDFVATWFEVSHAIKDEALCQLEWQDFSGYGKDARHAWQRVKWRRPADQVYAFNEAELANFSRAHEALGQALEGFVVAVRSGDQCTAQQVAEEVDNALWGLLHLFGSRPAPDGTNQS